MTRKEKNAYERFQTDRDEIAPEYEISESRPNPYADRYARGTTMVRLDPDVARGTAKSGMSMSSGT
jgi:hypothetical protein